MPMSSENLDHRFGYYCFASLRICSSAGSDKTGPANGDNVSNNVDDQSKFTSEFADTECSNAETEIARVSESGMESSSAMEGHPFETSTKPGQPFLYDCDQSATIGQVSDRSEYSSEAFAISDIIKHANNRWDNETERSLRQYREKLKEFLVIEVLKCLKVPELCLRFFKWAGQQIGFSHTPRTYEALLEIAGFNTHCPIPSSFLLEIKKEDDDMLGKLLNIMIRKCSRTGMWNEAIEGLGKLKDCGHKPTSTTYKALIQVLLAADQLELARQIYSEMSDSGFSIDSYTLGCFARCLCKAGRWKEALNMMDKVDFTPDTVIYTKMISGLCEASMLDEAFAFMHKMRANSCIPNVVTYNTLLGSFLKAGQLTRCKKIVSQMMSEGCRPSASIFNSLINAYCKAGQFTDAYKLLKKMAPSGCPPNYVTYNTLIGGICEKEVPLSTETLDLAKRVYHDMLSDGFILNKVNVGRFSRCLCSGGKFEEAFSVIQEMMKKGFIPDTSTYTKVITLLCHANKIDKAILLFKEMKQNGVVPNVYTYTVLIDNFCKVGLIQQAHKWFDEMKKEGCPPNVVTYTTLVHGYLKMSKISEANEIFGEMVASGCAPNIITYTVLIDGHCKAGDVEKACQIYSRMRGSGLFPNVDIYFDQIKATGIEPNVFTYGALIDGLCKVNRLEEAHELWKAMLEAGCEPSDIAFNSLIDGLCKAGQLEEAHQVFLKMAEDGHTPDVYTYSSLIDRLLKDSRLDLALKVLSKMMDNGCAPNVVTYTEIVDGLCKVGKTEEAYKLFTMMQEKGCPPDVITYTVMMDGLGKAGKIDQAIGLLQQMVEKSCAPDFVTYRVLIDHCCRAGKLSEAQKLLDEMKHTCWPPYAMGSHGIIRGMSKEFIASHDLLDEITASTTVPISAAYLMLIDSLCKAGELESALELQKEMMSWSSHLHTTSATTYALLIEGLCKSGNVEKAFELYEEMTRKGCIPETTVFAHLIKGLCMLWKRDEALQLLNGICKMVLNWHVTEKDPG